MWAKGRAIMVGRTAGGLVEDVGQRPCDHGVGRTTGGPE